VSSAFDDNHDGQDIVPQDMYEWFYLCVCLEGVPRGWSLGRRDNFVRHWWPLVHFQHEGVQQGQQWDRLGWLAVRYARDLTVAGLADELWKVMEASPQDRSSPWRRSHAADIAARAVPVHRARRRQRARADRALRCLRLGGLSKRAGRRAAAPGTAARAAQAAGAGGGGMSGYPSWAGLLDWDKAQALAEATEADWITQPFLEAGTLSSVYADPKDGKSLFWQLLARDVALTGGALGTPGTGESGPVLYIHHENPDSIIGERFLDMAASSDLLKRYLVYCSFPAMKTLDTLEGGQMLFELVNAVYEAHGQLPRVTVIDTLSKTFTGAENSADTFSDLYRYSLMPFRRAKMTVAYLDHSGKDPLLGQRGSSAKPSDVDVVWRLRSQKGPRDLIQSFHLEPTHSRAGHVEAFSVAVRQEPLRLEMSSIPVSARAAELATILDRLGVPQQAPREQCRQILKNQGIAAKTSDLAEAVKARKRGDNRGDSAVGQNQGTGRGQ
jgi:hypothetical protein